MNPKSSNFGNETYSAAAMLDCGELLAHQEANDESSPRISTERESSSQAGDSLPENPHGRPGTKDGPFPFPRWKRIFDITVVLLTLPCWFPLMVLVCLGIRIVSWGPVFFVQERVGYRGRRFMCLKFRSMRVNVETESHERHFERLVQSNRPMIKLDASGDPRLIPWGRLLRASCLDELPQIFNVLRGEMSIVGPRPCIPKEFGLYDLSQQERVNAPPGLTGYWQVHGKNRTTFNEMIDMDIYYATHMSVRLDLAIILKTIPAIVDQMLGPRAEKPAENKPDCRKTVPLT